MPSVLLMGEVALIQTAESVLSLTWGRMDPEHAEPA